MSRSIKLFFQWRLVLTSMVAGLIATAIVVTFQFGPTMLEASNQVPLPNTLPDKPISAESNLEEVLVLMLYSHTTWNTADVKATDVVRDPQTGKEYGDWIHLQITQPINAHLELGWIDHGLREVWISNGESLFRESLEDNIYASTLIPEHQKIFVNSFSVPVGGDIDKPTVYLHPFSVWIPTTLSESLYPTGIAQNMLYSAETTILGEDSIAGRQAVVLLRQHFKDDTLFKKHIYWIDTQTGVILKSEVCDYNQTDPLDGFDCNWISALIVTEITFDTEEIAPEVFTPTPLSPNSRLISWDEFENNMSWHLPRAEEN